VATESLATTPVRDIRREASPPLLAHAEPLWHKENEPMNIRRISTVLVSTAGLLIATGTYAGAAPIQHGFHVTAPCDNGQTLDVIVPPGHGEWTSGSVVGGRGTFKVYAFTFSDTAADGTVDGPYTDLQAGGAVEGHNPHATVTCTQTVPDGAGGTISLQIIGFFTA
jgi:hypothetical protein